MKIFELFPNPRFFGESRKLSDVSQITSFGRINMPISSVIYIITPLSSVGREGGGEGVRNLGHAIYIDTKSKSPNSPKNHKKLSFNCDGVGHLRRVTFP